jgi:PIN domain nuclease of toxin-antitoxin system
MKYLLDTQLLLWTAQGSSRLSSKARKLIEADDNTLFFSAASLWEIAIKAGLGREDFVVDAGELRRGLLDNGYRELPVTGAHAVAVIGLPGRHKDPFDRMLLTQAMHEGLVLATADAVLAGYDGPIVEV